MLLIMLLFLHFILAFLTCLSCLLQWACIPSSDIFIIFASRPFIQLSAFAFFLIVQCLQVQAVDFVILSLSFICASDTPVILISDYFPQGLFTHPGPFPLRHLLLDHSQNLGIASHCFLNTSISFPHLLTYPSLLYSTWSLVFQIAFLLFTD